MPRAVEIDYALDCANRSVEVGDKVAYTWYEDSKLHIGKVVKITEGTFNCQVYIEIPYTGTGKGFYNWRTGEYSQFGRIRRPAKNVALI